MANIASANGIEICYETFGSPDDPTLLLVMGFGVQMTEWDPEFCEEFAAHGFHVVRFDNRDVGLSTHFDDVEPDETPYLLADMADDIAGLLDALGIEKAHVVGSSMGGMIAQNFAARHPDRLLSLACIISTSGSPDVQRATRAAFEEVAKKPIPTTRDAYIEAAVRRALVLRGGGFPFDEDRIRRRAANAFDRAFDPAGRERQKAAIAASPTDRTEELKSVTVPIVAIHGTDDPLVHVSGSKSIVASAPDAELILIPGLGHELPPQVWTRIVEAVAWNARRRETTDDENTTRGN